MSTPILSQPNKNTCIACGNALYPNSHICRSCTRKTREPNKLCIECGIRPADHSYHRCNVCLHQRRKLKHKCSDCGSPVDHLSTRCRSCGLKYRKSQADLRKEKGLDKKYRCDDCGIGVSFKATYCRSCKKNHRPVKVKITPSCVDCGGITRDSHSTRCRDCYVASISITVEDYQKLADERGVTWIGELPSTSENHTLWRCKNGHDWSSSYANIKHGSNCPNCLDYDNGKPSSKPQRAIFDMIGGILNHKVGRYTLDVALQLPTANIAIEYDAWYWHGNKLERDARKTKNLISLGWRVLRIKTNDMLPTLEKIQDCIYLLLDGSSYQEIVLPDWGKGKYR